MANAISKLVVSGTTYDIKDAYARSLASGLLVFSQGAPTGEGEEGKLYIDYDKGDIYAWRGVAFVQLTPGNDYEYTLPLAGAGTFGGVKSGGDVTIASGIITINDDSHNHVIGNIDGLQAALDSKPTLVNGLIPSSYLPGTVDEIVEVDLTHISGNTPGAADKIYVCTDNNKTYRWSGSTYTEISASIALGTTSSTAFAGDKGQVAYAHSQDSTVHVTQAEKNVWSSKAEADLASSANPGLMDAGDKAKLDTVAVNANQVTFSVASETLTVTVSTNTQMS